jgi:hypothetical protein
MKRWWMMACACLLAGAAGCGFCSKNLGPQPGEDQYERAGYPREVSRWAHPSDTGRYFPYEVGGGAAVLGEGPHFDEGTFGWDYGGFCLPSKVDLCWWHGKYQGGTGAYKTDGPKPCHKLKEKRSEQRECHGECKGSAGGEKHE